MYIYIIIHVLQCYIVNIKILNIKHVTFNYTNSILLLIIVFHDIFTINQIL